jgi:hypothetical protein
MQLGKLGVFNLHRDFSYKTRQLSPKSLQWVARRSGVALAQPFELGIDSRRAQSCRERPSTSAVPTRPQITLLSEKDTKFKSDFAAAFISNKKLPDIPFVPTNVHFGCK